MEKGKFPRLQCIKLNVIILLLKCNFQLSAHAAPRNTEEKCYETLRTFKLLLVH